MEKCYLKEELFVSWGQWWQNISKGSSVREFEMSAPIDGFITPPSIVIQGETDSPTIHNNKTSLQALIEILIYRLSRV